ncbi:hypothetical protein Tco_0891672 [Tanacetum coccineum]|uniref:Uncharacterized protein n=1 Tax=Tanacetum coccineum TaxID=301880 RepID=A0ABQ5C3M6_9ASTR
MMEQQVRNPIMGMVVVQVDEHQLIKSFVDMIVAMLVLDTIAALMVLGRIVAKLVLDTIAALMVLGRIVAKLVLDKIGAHTLVCELKLVVDAVIVELCTELDSSKIRSWQPMQLDLSNVSCSIILHFHELHVA